MSLDLDAGRRDIAAEMSEREERGAVASYIPQLAHVDPRRFGIAVMLADGTTTSVAMTRPLRSSRFRLHPDAGVGKVGDALWRRVGREPLGQSVQRSSSRGGEGHPAQPFINAGAIVVTDTLLGVACAEGGDARSCASCATSPTTTRSSSTRRWRVETATGHRNMALANYMHASAPSMRRN